jgi:hypothetical protein
MCRLLVPAMALLGALFPWWVARTHPAERAFPALVFDGVATAMAGIWIASPVLSPQYLVWGLPVFFFASSSAARFLYLLALGVTRIEYPACYPFIAHLELSGLIVLTVRNGLLIATWVALLRSWSPLPVAINGREFARRTSSGFGWREQPPERRA